MNLLTELYECMHSGGSGRGMSFWTMAADCGKRAVISEEADAAGQPREIYFDVGAVYHKLHEVWRQSESADLSEADLQAANEAIIDGSRLFNLWRCYWDKDYWGTTVAVEQVLPSSFEALARVHEIFGEVVNAKPDLVVDVSTADLQRVKERVPDLPGPGRYIIDFKTSSRPSSPLLYSESLQALWYPLAWDIEHPDDQPIKGVIFDILYKPYKRKDGSTSGDAKFDAVYSPVQQNIESLKGLIDQGRANMQRASETDRGNRAACVRYKFGNAQVCPYRGKECQSA